MSLNEVDPAADRSTANGSTTVFPYTFKILLKTDIEVLVDATVQTVDTHYTVDGLGVSGGGNVTFLVAPAADTIVTRLRKQPASQASQYLVGEAFPSDRVEKDLDKLAMMVQQVKEVLRRTFTLLKSSSVVDQTIDEPVVGSFARGKVGGGIDWATVVSAGSISVPVSIAEGGTGAITAALARTALSVPTLAEAGVQADNVFRVTGSADASKRVAFEVDGLTTATTRTLTVQDKNGTLALTSEFDYSNVPGSPGRMPFAQGQLFGATISNNATDATNDIDIAAGQCRDGANTANMINAALTKQLDAAWAVGTNQGGLDTGAIANTTYHVWIIQRPDTGVVDALFSTSATAPTMPANYTIKRRVASFIRSGGAIVGVVQVGDRFYRKVPINSISTANPGTSAVLATTHIPTGLALEWIGNAMLQVTDTSEVGLLLSDPATTDTAPSTLLSHLSSANIAGNQRFSTQARIGTNTSAQVRYRLSGSNTNITVILNTTGWVDTRGRI